MPEIRDLLRRLLPGPRVPVTAELEDIKRVVDAVDGWLRDEEGKLLYWLARNCVGRGVIVEIGSWKGKSTIWLAKGSQAGKRVAVYAVDPHDGSGELKHTHGALWSFDDFKANLAAAHVDDVVVPLVRTSEEAARGFDTSVELIFIDGDHEYSAVRADFEAWFPKVAVGGIMAFHDADAPGPRRVAEQFVVRSRHFRNVSFVDSILVAEKVAENSLVDRIRNRLALGLRSQHVPGLVRDVGRRLIERRVW